MWFVSYYQSCLTADGHRNVMGIKMCKVFQTLCHCHKFSYRISSYKTRREFFFRAVYSKITLHKCAGILGIILGRFVYEEIQYIIYFVKWMCDNPLFCSFLEELRTLCFRDFLLHFTNYQNLFRTRLTFQKTLTCFEFKCRNSITFINYAMLYTA